MPAGTVTDLVLRDLALSASTTDATAPFVATIEFEVLAEVVFDLDISLDLTRDGAPAGRSQLRAEGWDPAWLPRGCYRAHALAPRAGLARGRHVLEAALWHRERAETLRADAARREFDAAAGDGGGPRCAWQLEGLPGTVPIESLSWRKHGWFHSHFDHAARTVAGYMLGDAPALAGRVLDVGCGDGVTDLGLELRWKPEALVGIDPFRGYERLLGIAHDAGLKLAALPPMLRFLPADANALPFADDEFDVVLSWGSLEHIAGGYARALGEIRRVLKPGGLFFVHPGLYYSDIGNHLGEFAFARAEPYVHLKLSPEALRERVLGSEPDRIDRAGHVATPAEYWRWYTELNPITVAGFEAELRALDFEPWRVALRTHDRVDYTPELQRHSFVDLAVGELYVSCINRKRAR
jgi:SAM-dependent methyltransferase